jgi:hypothetical protein
MNYQNPNHDQQRKDELLHRDRFLNMRRLPARMVSEEAAKCFGMTPHDIPILVANGLLKPLGNPGPNSVKYFARVIVEELGNDVKWLHRATATIRLNSKMGVTQGVAGSWSGSSKMVLPQISPI